MLFSNILKDETFVPGARLALSLSALEILRRAHSPQDHLCFVVLRCVLLCYNLLHCVTRPNVVSRRHRSAQTGLDDARSGLRARCGARIKARERRFSVSLQL